MRKGRLGEKEAALFSPPYPAERPAARRKIPRRNKSMISPLSRGIFYMKKARQPPRLFRCDIFLIRAVYGQAYEISPCISAAGINEKSISNL